MTFSIESPDLQAFARKIQDLDVNGLVEQATKDVAHGGMITDLRRAAGTSGASRAMRRGIKVFQDEAGEARVGVPADRRVSQEAFDLEYGTATDAPSGWMRATMAQGGHDYDEAFATALTHRLSKAWKP